MEERFQSSKRMRTLIETLNEATKAYDEGHPIMSDAEWDNLYFQLVDMEFEEGYKLANSPTQQISYKVVNQLEKVTHNHKMLSLDKTKDLTTVYNFLNYKSFIAMCKMDGLTCSLHYKDGILIGAETRGNGLVGENIIHNAKVIPTIPKIINYKKELIIDGEIICPYNKFQQFAEEYKNPRNFAAGSIRLLNSRECETRCLKFVAWDVIKGLDKRISHFSKDENGNYIIDERIWFEDDNNFYLHNKLLDLKKLGFTVVPYIHILNMKNEENFSLEKICSDLKEKAVEFSYPIDGIVFKFDNIEYGKSLGETSHHFKNAIAYKFYDELYETTVKDVEWTMGRTGALTPVAILEPIDIDGTIVSRASLHNYGIMYNEIGLKYKGQKVDIFKANMIIPQIEKAYPCEDAAAAPLLPPSVCPICGGPVKIIENNGVQVLTCINPDCDGKFINKLDHFVGKKGLDIKGLSKATLEKLISWGWVSSLEDIFNLKNYKKEWVNKAGFGEKSVQRILDAIEVSKSCTLETFISSLGIPLIGNTVAKELIKYINSYDDFRNKVKEQWDFTSIPNFGESKKNAILNYDYTEADRLIAYLTIKEKKQLKNIYALSGLTFVITGKLKHFKNRKELVSFIEDYGGRVTESISAKTSFLVNNDINSNSTKNLTAKQLNIPIISEAELINMI